MAEAVITISMFAGIAAAAVIGSIFLGIALGKIKV